MQEERPKLSDEAFQTVAVREKTKSKFYTTAHHHEEESAFLKKYSHLTDAHDYRDLNAQKPHKKAELHHYRWSAQHERHREVPRTRQPNHLSTNFLLSLGWVLRDC